MPNWDPEANDLFLRAIEIAAPEDRRRYLDDACAGRQELRDCVDGLIRAGEQAGSFLEHRAPDMEPISALGHGAEATGMHTPRPGADPAPPLITAEYRGHPEPDVLIAGRYTLQEKIGEGGMGEVWVARQSEPVKRKVALKLIKPGMDSRAVLQRFEQERQALALMDHPNIARVLDAGMTPNGQPFFVMELVNGLPLNRFCDELRLTPKERLQLFVPICQAVQHAHQKGIVHRDLKPANILITMIDARPVPKVIDFGVAKATAGKLTDESMSTQFGAVVGTLEYMSPEQAAFSGEDIDTRADIYSLGVILYELLTGLRPFDAARLKKAALTEMMRIIREDEPSKPSTRLSTDASLPSLAALRQTDPRKLMTILRGDLDWVVMKCLEKQRERRYETANALARDVQRYLDGDAVEACPPSVGYRLGKFLTRHRGPVAAAGIVLLALIAGFISTAIGLLLADRAWRAEAAQRAVAVEQKTRAEASEALARAQSSRAEAREEQAIDAVMRFRDAVADNPELKNNPALEPLRKMLLKEPLAFFKALREQLQADNDTRPESLLRLARASDNLGRLTNEIGNKRDALIAYREALAISQKLADANPAGTRYQRYLAGRHNEIGILLRGLGQPAEAAKAHEAALPIFQKLADANPAVAEFQSDLATGHNSIGNLLAETGKPAAALKAYEVALAIRQRLADTNPAVAQFQSDLATCRYNIASVLKDTGKLAEALTAHEAALAIRQRLADTNPAVAQFQSDLAASHNNVGNLLRGLGQPAEAAKAHEAAQAIFQKLAAANPTVVQYQSDLAGSRINIGILLAAAGKPAEALKVYEAALAIQRKLADANPTVTRFQFALAASYNNIGVSLRNTGKPGEALKAYEAALAIQERLARQHPESLGYASGVGSLLDNMALIDLQFRRFDAARERLQQAIVWQKKALANNPGNRQYRQLLIDHLTKLVRAARGLGDSEGVAEAERELATLRDSNPAIVALDGRLTAIIKGDQRPKDEAERLRLAQRAYDRALYAAAARLWAEALSADPTLGDERQAQHRYNAACAAALAGSGQGNDDPKPDDMARARLRKQALDWLKAELSAWKRVAMTAEPGNKELVARTLAHWKQDADLAGIRDSQELAKLPAEERVALKQLWDEVNELLIQPEGVK
jgi:serine/threonine protein kinase/tetratricopeptide (TPR) repeat protein